MKNMSFRTVRFVASPSGIIITFGFLTVALATAVNLQGISFGLGTAGSIAVVAGLSRRLIRSDERYKSSYQTQKHLQQELSQLHAQNERSKADFDQLIHKSEAQDNHTQKQIETVEQRIDQLIHKSEAQDNHTQKQIETVEQRIDQLIHKSEAQDNHTQKDVSIGDLRLAVLGGNWDADWYDQRGAHEERHSPLYNLVNKGGFRSFIDVGANYGFVSILARQAAPSIHVVAIEADPRLIPLVHTNLERNGVTDASVIHAIAGPTVDNTTTFSLNPNSTLDNRVSMDSWEKLPVAQLTLGSIIDELTLPNPIFLKIDTQGFEASVLAGASSLLSTRDDWMIKMEFGPMWLRSQSVDPAAFLGDLCGRFTVVEFPARVAFAEQSLKAIFRNPIEPLMAKPFVDYVTSLNKHGRGWVDLLVRSRPHG